MILTCPECATRFSTKAEAIGPNGRTVRCSQCSTTWFASADPDILSLNDIQATVTPDFGTDRRASDRDENRSVDEFDIPEITSGAAEEGGDPAPHAVIRDKAERKKVKRRLLSVAMIWIVTLAILGIALVTAWFFRAQIVERFPAAAGIYEALGVEANANGLEIFEIEVARGDNEGVPVVFVNGKVKNTDLRVREIPMIELSFVNANKEVLAQWVVEPPRNKLNPGGSLNFSSQYPNPPVDAPSLIASFVDETGAITNIPIGNPGQ